MIMNVIKVTLANKFAILADNNDNALDELFESQIAKKANPGILPFIAIQSLAYSMTLTTTIRVKTKNRKDKSRNKTKPYARMSMMRSSLYTK